MLVKTGVFFGWAGLSYALLLLWATSWWTAVPLAASLGLALAGIGFCVMHDGGHAAYSNSPRLNRLAALSLDAMGASSFVWNFKHNVLHHTYTNIEGADDDIEFEPFLRLTPDQPRRWFHRFQAFYWPLLLCFLPTKWILFDDFRDILRGEIAGQALPKPPRRELALVLLGKLSFLTYGIFLPLAIVPWGPFLLGYAIVTSVWGVTLGTVFQLAHAVDGAAFYAPEPGDPVELPWAEHQLATTVDFARSNRPLTWYVGGLNHQLEHHLFPRVGHQHYPALATIVRTVCAGHGITPLDNPTLLQALGAHLRHLARLGRSDSPQASPPGPFDSTGPDHSGRAQTSAAPMARPSL